MTHSDSSSTLTIGEAFAAGRRLAVRKFWPSMGLSAVFGLVALLPTEWIRLESMRHGGGVVLPLLLGGLLISLLLPGLYHGLWKGASGGKMRLRDLFWVFGRPSRLGVVLTLVALGLPPQLVQITMMGTATMGQPGSAAHGAWLIIMAWYVVLGAVPIYVLSASARFDLGAGAALRTALRCFQAGHRRWLVLPWALSAAFVASGALLAVIVGAGIALLAALRAGHPAGAVGVLVALVVTVLLVPLTLAWAAMGMTWSAGAFLAAVGDLHANAEDRGSDGVPDTVPLGMHTPAE